MQTYRTQPLASLAQSVVDARLKRYIDGTLDLEPGERRQNIPESITETIAQYAIHADSGIFPFKPATGDLMIPGPFQKRVEVKGVSSTGPMSFGPTEKWDKLVVVHIQDLVRGYDPQQEITHQLENRHFTVYEFDHSNQDFSHIVMSTKSGETYRDQSNSGRRPRFNLPFLMSQLPSRILFQGTLHGLFQKSAGLTSKNSSMVVTA